jgi:hypothetical protein
MFFDGDRFTCERGFFYFEVDGLDQAHVGRYLVAGDEEYHVTGYEVARRDFAFAAVAYDGGCRRSHPA